MDCLCGGVVVTVYDRFSHLCQLPFGFEQSFITMLRACGSVLQGHSTVIVSTMESLLHQMR